MSHSNADENKIYYYYVQLIQQKSINIHYTNDNNNNTFYNKYLLVNIHYTNDNNNDTFYNKYLLVRQMKEAEYTPEAMASTRLNLWSSFGLDISWGVGMVSFDRPSTEYEDGSGVPGELERRLPWRPRSGIRFWTARLLAGVDGLVPWWSRRRWRLLFSALRVATCCCNNYKLQTHEFTIGYNDKVMFVLYCIYAFI